MSANTRERQPAAQPCGRSVSHGPTSRRVILGAFLGLGAVSALHGSLDQSAWRAFEAVEEAWIRDRFELLIQQAPAAANAARLDLDIKLSDLARRAIQFRHLLSCEPSLLRGGIWQLTALPVSDSAEADMSAASPEYRKLCEQIRTLAESLRNHKEYGALQRAQVRLWKTPQYREVHRRYTGRMQDLQRVYGPGGAADGVAAGGK